MPDENQSQKPQTEQASTRTWERFHRWLELRTRPRQDQATGPESPTSSDESTSPTRLTT